MTGPSDKPEYGENVISWQNVWDRLYPGDAGDPHDDSAAAEMHRLRGLVAGQCAEIEAVLGMIVKRFRPHAHIEKRTAGQLLNEARRLLNAEYADTHKSDLNIIGQAVDRRNNAIHSPVTIGSSWVPYDIMDGEWIPVISIMNDEPYDEADLRRDLALQQEATVAAVRLLHSCGGFDLLPASE